MALVYVSSTYRDLVDYRAAVGATLRRLEHTAIAMEDYVAADERPVDRCLGDVERCDVYIGLFAWRYGYIPEEDNPAGSSITELELRCAEQMRKPRLLFLLDPGFEWRLEFVDSHTGDGNSGERIRELREELERSRLIDYFTSPDDLAAKASTAIQRTLGVRVDVAAETLAQRAERRFSQFMRRFAGARSEPDALRRYLPLLVRRGDADPARRGGVPEPATWPRAVSYPAALLLVGASGAGKTTLLLHEARRLAVAALEDDRAPLVFYVSLAGFDGGDEHTVLELAAQEQGVDAKEADTAWHTSRRPLCLLLDAADESPAPRDLLSAIQELTERRRTHSVVVACRPGELRARIRAAAPALSELILLPPSPSQVDELLKLYGASSVAPVAGRMAHTELTPDLLAALAASARDLAPDHVPHTTGAVFRLHAERLLELQAGAYDSRRVKGPLLAWLALHMLSGNAAELDENDDLLRGIARVVTTLYRDNKRLRRVMPTDWTAQDLLAELVTSGLLERPMTRPGILRFAKARHRDIFAAAGLADLAPTPARLRRLLHGADAERWADALGALLDVEPDVRTIWDALPDPGAAAAVQVWIEHRAQRAPAPASLAAALRTRRDDEPPPYRPTHSEAARKLRAGDARARVNAVLEWSQGEHWEALVAAARHEDDLARGLARYALVHAGTGRLDGDPRSSTPAILDAFDPPRVVATVQGAGIARIGSLHLLDVGGVSANTVRLVIRDFAEDLTAGPVCIDPISMPPTVMAAAVFTETGAVNWLDLTVRCVRIAQAATGVAECATSYPDTEELGAASKTRAEEFAAFATALLKALGLPDDHLGALAAPGATIEAAHAKLDELLRRYGRNQQAQWLDVARFPTVDSSGDGDQTAAAEPLRVESVMTVETVEGTVVGIHADEVTPGNADDTGLVVLHFNQVADHVSRGRLTGLEIDRVTSARSAAPTLLIRGNVVVKSADDGVLEGVRVGGLRGRHTPWLSDISIVVNRAASTVIRGITVDKPEHRRIESDECAPGSSSPPALIVGDPETTR